MSERLIIRLASEFSQQQHWLIWSESEKEIIASGEIENAQQLSSLTEKAESRQVICLLPSVDVAIKQVAINGSFNRQMQQALPYLIEEELASDVEKLHLSVIAKRTDLVHVAVCDKSRMANWLAWLEEAQISCRQFIPEAFALPLPSDDCWQAVQLGNDWLVRESKEVAWSCEKSMLSMILASKASQDNPLQIENYSAAEALDNIEWQQAQPVLPMQLLATGAIASKINLLTGEFKVHNESSEALLKWRLPALLAMCVFVVACVNLYLQNKQLEGQVDAQKVQTEKVYQQAFPNKGKARYSRIKRSINGMLADTGTSTNSAEFLMMLNDIAPHFKSNQQLSPSTLKYDAAKNEMRILAVGDNFQAFEKFSTQLSEKYSLKQGALNSSKNKVNGLLTIRKQ